MSSKDCRQCGAHMQAEHSTGATCSQCGSFVPAQFIGGCLRIITTFNHPSIPMRRFDWEAVTENHTPGDPIGYGATEEAAALNLKEQLAHPH